MKFLSETKGGVENLGFSNQDVHDENRVRGLVWVDPRSMNAYKNFDDVITFDSTYRTNRDETEASYKWVLRTWLEAVDNKPPRTIITDQDIALRNAIVEVMPMPQTKWTMNDNKIAGPLPYAPPAIGNDGASQPLREKRYLKDSFADEERSERTHGAKTEEDNQHDPIFDPPTSNTKGRKKTKRFKS
ncbi:hypothetical protein AgCh_036232 [Apium graveolens]